MLEGIAKAAAGVPKIEVTFEVDANGILNVSAVDTAGGSVTKITITKRTGMGRRTADDADDASDLD